MLPFRTASILFLVVRVVAKDDRVDLLVEIRSTSFEAFQAFSLHLSSFRRERRSGLRLCGRHGRGGRGCVGIAFRLLFRLFDRALYVGLKSGFIVVVIVFYFDDLSRARRRLASLEL